MCTGEWRGEGRGEENRTEARDIKPVTFTVHQRPTTSFLHNENTRKCEKNTPKSTASRITHGNAGNTLKPETRADMQSGKKVRKCAKGTLRYRWSALPINVRLVPRNGGKAFGIRGNQNAHIRRGIDVGLPANYGEGPLPRRAHCDRRRRPISPAPISPSG